MGEIINNTPSNCYNPGRQLVDMIVTNTTDRVEILQSFLISINVSALCRSIVCLFIGLSYSLPCKENTNSLSFLINQLIIYLGT